MNKAFFACIIIIIVAVFGGVLLYATDLGTDINALNNGSLGDDSVKNVTAINNTTKNTSNSGVVAIQSGPSSAKEGSSVTITWKVKNNCDKTITDVEGLDQNFNYHFGSLAPGESKSVQYSLYIPSVQDLKNAGFGISEDDENDDDFYIGGFSLSYKYDGKIYSINSNDILIILE